ARLAIAHEVSWSGLVGRSGLARATRWRSTLHGGRIAAKTVAQESGDAPYRGYADAREFVDAPVRQVLLQQLHDLPAIHECLQLRGRAEILEEAAALSDVFETDDGPEQRVFVAAAFGLGVGAVGLHTVDLA